MQRGSRGQAHAPPVRKGLSEREIRLVTALRELLAVLNSDRTLAEILEYLLEQTAELLASDACAIYLLEVEHGQTILKVGAARGLTPDRVARRLPIGSSITGLAVLKQRPVACADLRRALLDETDPDGERPLEERGTHVVVQHISGLLG